MASSLQRCRNQRSPTLTFGGEDARPSNPAAPQRKLDPGCYRCRDSHRCVLAERNMRAHFIVVNAAHVASLLGRGGGWPRLSVGATADRTVLSQVLGKGGGGGG